MANNSSAPKYFNNNTICLFRSGVRHLHDRAKPERVLQHPAVEHQCRFGSIQFGGHYFEYVAQRHDEQDRQRYAQLDTVQSVQVGDRPADELVSQHEHLYAVVERARGR